MRELSAVMLAAVVLAGCAGDSGGATKRRSPDATTTQTAPAAVADVATVRVGELPPLRVEVARTPDERTRGLSGRDHLPPGTGMVFMYDSPTTTGFWMHDVHFPLSLAWVRDGRVIGTVEMTPCTTNDPSECRVYEPPGPFDMVIEAPAGTFADVDPGTPVRVRFRATGEDHSASSV